MKPASMIPGPAIVCLVGLRCAGKSSVGRALAALLDWPFEDLDLVLARRWAQAEGLAQPPAPGELLARVGLQTFRALEGEALAELCRREPPLVIATGGGCVETPGNRVLLGAARTFWLDGPVEVLVARLAADPTPRPSLTGADPADEVRILADRRAPLYGSVAEAGLDARRSVEQLAEGIAGLLASEPPIRR
jgi:shikimate kinase